MEQDKILLLAQLIDSIESQTNILEKAYNENKKVEFEKIKKIILDFQIKIGFLLK